MVCELTWPSKSLLAVGTLVWLFPSMCWYMRIEVGCSYKSLIAVRTLVGLFPSMCSYMYLKTAFASKCLIAVLTDMTCLVRTRLHGKILTPRLSQPCFMCKETALSGHTPQWWPPSWFLPSAWPLRYMICQDNTHATYKPRRDIMSLWSVYATPAMVSQCNIYLISLKSLI